MADRTNYGSDLPWVRPPDLNGDIPILDTEIRLSNEGRRKVRVVPKGAVLVWCIGSVGRTGIAGQELATNQQINAIVFGPRVIPEFGLYYLTSVADEIQRRAVQSTVLIINKSDFSKIQVPVAPIAEQRRIVDILNRANAIRRLRREALEKAQQIIPALFGEMFGDPADNPRGWPIAELGEYLQFVTSGSRGWSKYYTDSGAKFIRVQNLTGGKLEISKTAYVRPPASAETARTSIRPDDLLISITGVPGLVAVAPVELGDAYVSQHVAIARLVPNTLDPSYVAGYLSHDRGGQRQFFANQYGQTRPGLGLNQIRSIAIPLPPPTIQREFSARLTNVHSIIAQQERAAVAADRLVNSLMAEVFAA